MVLTVVLVPVTMVVLKVVLVSVPVVATVVYEYRKCCASVKAEK